MHSLSYNLSNLNYSLLFTICYKSHSATTPSLPLAVHQVPPRVLLHQTVLTRVGLGKINCSASSQDCAQYHQVGKLDASLTLGLE